MTFKNCCSKSQHVDCAVTPPPVRGRALMSSAANLASPSSPVSQANGLLAPPSLEKYFTRSPSQLSLATMIMDRTPSPMVPKDLSSAGIKLLKLPSRRAKSPTLPSLRCCFVRVGCGQWVKERDRFHWHMKDCVLPRIAGRKLV